MPQEFISWKDFEKDCLSLGTYVKKPDIIIAIGRGGWVPAAILSHKFKTNTVYNFGLKSYEDKKADSIQIIQDIDLNKFDKSKNILIVDDISDKGLTLKYVYNYFKNNGFEHIETLTLYTKSGTGFIPDLYSKEFDKGTWVVFPWESKL